MAISSTRKAAMLLATLDPAVAAELLKAAGPDMITNIVSELTRLDSSSYESGQDVEVVKEFSGHLAEGFGRDDTGEFVREVLEGAVGPERTRQLLEQVEQLEQLRDPFRSIRSQRTDLLATALKGESPQVAAMVLGELPAKKSVEMLELLDESVRSEAVRSMAAGKAVASEAKLRVALAVEHRLDGLAVEGASAVVAVTEDDGRDDKLRKVALLLRRLKTEVRDELLEGISAQDEETSQLIQRLMVVWEDLTVIGDRSLQEALRSGDSRKLALALVGAGEAITQRIRENMSARAGAMLDEEASLLSSPSEDEIAEARESVLETLREMCAKGELELIED